MEREKPKLKSINLMAPNPTVGTWQIWNLNPGPNNSNVDIIFKESQIEYSDGEESACNAGDPGSIPGLERSPGEGNGNPFLAGTSHGQRNQVGYSPWGPKSQTQLSD